MNVLSLIVPFQLLRQRLMSEQIVCVYVKSHEVVGISPPACRVEVVVDRYNQDDHSKVVLFVK